MRHIRFSDLAETPWRNGGGITREVAEGRDGGALAWRLSMADVASDGPFSDFGGLTRTLTVVDGAGMRLSGPDGSFEAPYGRPVTFDGGTAIAATLIDGPVRDLNLMVAPALCTGTVEPLHGPLDATYPAETGRTWGVHCLAGTVAAGDGALAPGDTALAEGEALALRMEADALVLLIALQAGDPLRRSPSRRPSPSGTPRRSPPAPRAARP